MQPMPDMATLLKIAQSPAGQKLLALLRSDPSADLGSITAAAASGNMEEAKKQLKNVLTSPDAQELLKQLEMQI